MTPAAELGTITCPTVCPHHTVFILMLSCSGLLLTSLLCSLGCARHPSPPLTTLFAHPSCLFMTIGCLLPLLRHPTLQALLFLRLPALHELPL